MSKDQPWLDTNEHRHPKDGFGAEYPFNRVKVHWPSGHEEHYDSTVGNERIRIAHMPSGTYHETKKDGRTVRSHTADQVDYTKGGKVATYGGAKNKGKGGGGSGGGGTGGGGTQAQNGPNPGSAGGNLDVKIGDAQTGGSARHETGGGKYADMGGGKGQVIGGHEKKIVGGKGSGTSAYLHVAKLEFNIGESKSSTGGASTTHVNGPTKSVHNGTHSEEIGTDKTSSTLKSQAQKVSKNMERKYGGDDKKDVGGSTNHKSGGDSNHQAGGNHTTKGKNVDHNASQGMAMKAGQAISMLSKLMSMGSGSGGGGGGGGGAGTGGGHMAANDSGISIGQGNNSIAANTIQITTTGNVVVNDLLLINGNTTINATAVFKAAIAEQGYDLQSSLANNFFYVVPGNVSLVVLNLSGLFGKGTITTPAAPIDGQRFRVTTANSITTLTINANSGQAVSGAPTTMAANTPFGFAWVNSLATWFRV